MQHKWLRSSHPMATKRRIAGDSKHLNVSPSAISIQICGTKASYNVKLLDRDSDLPSMGRCLYFAQEIVSQPIISILKQTLLKSVRAEAIQKSAAE